MSGLLVIGAGPGLGRSVALRFAREGWPVSLAARRPETLDAVAAGVAATGVPVSRHQADAGDPAAVQRAVAEAVEAHGLPRAVVYNAGLIQADAPGDLTADEHRQARALTAMLAEF